MRERKERERREREEREKTESNNRDLKLCDFKMHDFKDKATREERLFQITFYGFICLSSSFLSSLSLFSFLSIFHDSCKSLL